MILDVMSWSKAIDGCARCGQLAPYYVPVYWRDGSICSKCCIELNKFYDANEWPKIH